MMRMKYCCERVDWDFFFLSCIFLLLLNIRGLSLLKHMCCFSLCYVIRWASKHLRYHHLAALAVSVSNVTLTAPPGSDFKRSAVCWRQKDGSRPPSSEDTAGVSVTFSCNYRPCFFPNTLNRCALNFCLTFRSWIGHDDLSLLSTSYSVHYFCCLSDLRFWNYNCERTIATTFLFYKIYNDQ